MFLFQKEAVRKCNMAGKPAVVTRVVDSMTDNLRPTRAEATDVANAVLDGIFWLLSLSNQFSKTIGTLKTCLFLLSLFIRKRHNPFGCRNTARTLSCGDYIYCWKNMCWGKLSFPSLGRNNNWFQIVAVIFSFQKFKKQNVGLSCDVFVMSSKSSETLELHLKVKFISIWLLPTRTIMFCREIVNYGTFCWYKMENCINITVFSIWKYGLWRWSVVWEVGLHRWLVGNVVSIDLLQMITTIPY